MRMPNRHPSFEEKLRRGLESIRRIAFEMGTTNQYTPRIMSMVVAMEAVIDSSFSGTGELHHAVENLLAVIDREYGRSQLPWMEGARQRVEEALKPTQPIAADDEYEALPCIRLCRRDALDKFLAKYWPELLQKLEAPPHQPASQAAWQPIETAPTDRRVDIWTGERRVTDCYWDHICREWRSYSAGYLSVFKSATHWMLPTSPPAQVPAGAQ